MPHYAAAFMFQAAIMPEATGSGKPPTEMRRSGFSAKWNAQFVTPSARCFRRRL
jgi:hypothetical protein